jgi:hypothetical protein
MSSVSKVPLKQNVERDATPMLYSRYEARWDQIYKTLGMRLIYICDMHDGMKYEMWDMTRSTGFYAHASVPKTQCDYRNWADWKICRMEMILS